MSYKLFDLNKKIIKKSNKGNYHIIPSNFTGILADDDKIHKSYYKTGVYHRLDGPARYYSLGDKTFQDYYINGEYVKGATLDSFKLLVDVMKLKGLL